MASGLLDMLTGGETSAAEDALNKAQQDIASVPSPTAQALTLPQLQQYVNAGLMTPAQMQAYLQQNNALATEDTAQTGTAAQVQALNQLSGVANAGAAGTPVEQAQQAQTIQQMNEAVGGQEGAIQQQAEARGDPGALVSQALQSQDVGSAAEAAYQNNLQSQAQAYQAALNAMSQGASVGQGLQAQQTGQANTVAQAQNAMQQFNAQNQQAASAANQSAQQQANAYNAQNAQNVSNQNTQTGQYQTEYNAQVPQTVYSDAMQKAAAEAGVSEQQAGQATAAGQQQAGLIGGLIGAGATVGGDYAMGNALANAPKTGAKAHGGIIGDHENCFHEGGLCMERGGVVPGKPKVAGDALKNDTVTAKVSPGEAVIPRTEVQQHLPQVLSLLAGHGHPAPSTPPHPDDVASVLHAMKKLRGAA